jgi:hypothetical protein
MNEKAVPFKKIEPGLVISQGRGGQAIIQDVVGNMLLTTQNKTGSNQQTLSVNDSISSIALLSGEAPTSIDTKIEFPSNNFNTINYEQTPISEIQFIKPIITNTTQSLESSVDIIPTQSVIQNNTEVQPQELIPFLTSSLFLDEQLLPDEESELYSDDVEGIEAESYAFLPEYELKNNINSKIKIDNVSILSTTNKETEEFIISVLQGLKVPVNNFTIAFIKAWRQAEGGSATWNLLNSTLYYNNSTNYNKVKVQNYKSKQDGIVANIKTLSLPKYSKIIKGLKSVKSLNDGYNLAVKLSDGSSNGPFYIWSLGYYDRILTLCSRGNSIYNRNKLCPPPKSISDQYIAKVLLSWIRINKINFTNYIKKPK